LVEDWIGACNKFSIRLIEIMLKLSLDCLKECCWTLLCSGTRQGSTALRQPLPNGFKLRRVMLLHPNTSVLSHTTVPAMMRLP